jgi:hypothetical protein
MESWFQVIEIRGKDSRSSAEIGVDEFYECAFT